MTVGAKVGGTLRARGLRLGPAAEDKTAILEEEEEADSEEERGGTRAPEGHAEEESGCSSKQVAFAIVPDKYEPLGADVEQQAQRAERKSRKRRRKLRKYGKVRASGEGRLGKGESRICASLGSGTIPEDHRSRASNKCAASLLVWQVENRALDGSAFVG